MGAREVGANDVRRQRLGATYTVKAAAGEKGRAQGEFRVSFGFLVAAVAAAVVFVSVLAVSLAVLGALMAGYGSVPGWQIIFLPLFLALEVMVALGAGLWLASLNVRYRDIRYTVPFMTQIWMYASPVIYPVTLVPSNWRWLISLNPLTGIIDGFRWAIVGQARPATSSLLGSLIVGSVLLLSGLLYFRHSERTFADLI